MEGKKVKKLVVILLIVVLLVVVIFAIITIRKVSIFNDLLAKAKESEKITNYYMEMKQNEGMTTQIWAKDESHYLMKNVGNDLTMTFYRNGDEELTATEANGQKIISSGSGKVLLYTFTNYMNSEDVWQEAVRASVKSVQDSNKECYEIRLKDVGTILVEKETGVVLKTETSEISYEINTVTDTDIQKPDLTGYTKLNQ